jgi:hypothetical protein
MSDASVSIVRSIAEKFEGTYDIARVARITRVKPF